MPQLIKDGAIVEDEWQLVSEEQAESANTSAKVILPYSYWQANQNQFESNKANIGVWINGDTDLSEIGTELSHFPLVAINFPGFMDGRGFSTGRLLRERYSFNGELRAIGAIIRDQFCYLKRCGFNAFRPTEDIDLQSALESLNDFQEYYQGDAIQNPPLFRRRTG